MAGEKGGDTIGKSRFISYRAAMRVSALAFGFIFVALAGCSRPQPATNVAGPDDHFIAAQEQSLNRAVAEEASENDAESASEINRPADNAR